ncbi:MAG: hypothetical protein Kow00121_62490 [Elainellaceae cyanobacterium]
MQKVQDKVLSSGSNVSNAHPFESPDLHPWDVGIAVAEMQELLRTQGFEIRVDGDFGWRTEVAVKRFQRQQGLRVDGIVGRETWVALRSAVKAGTRLLRQGRSGSDVAELQGLLQVHGYPVQRDGIFGTETRQAVVAFQQAHHLSGNGVVGATTWFLLRGRSLNK